MNSDYMETAGLFLICGWIANILGWILLASGLAVISIMTQSVAMTLFIAAGIFIWKAN